MEFYRFGRNGLRAMPGDYLSSVCAHLGGDPVAFTRFEDALLRMHAGWFEDAVQLANWDHARDGCIQTPAIYKHASRKQSDVVGQSQGCKARICTRRLRPQETAEATISMSR